MKDDEIILQEMQSADKDLEWLSENYENLRKKYPKKFVAIKNQNIVSSANKLEKLIKILKKKHGNPNEYIIDFIPDERYTLVV